MYLNACIALSICMPCAPGMPTSRTTARHSHGRRSLTICSTAGIVCLVINWKGSLKSSIQPGASFPASTFPALGYKVIIYANETSLLLATGQRWKPCPYSCALGAIPSDTLASMMDKYVTLESKWPYSRLLFACGVWQIRYVVLPQVDACATVARMVCAHVDVLRVIREPASISMKKRHERLSGGCLNICDASLVHVLPSDELFLISLHIAMQEQI